MSSPLKNAGATGADPGSGKRREAFEAGLEAYERGDWKSARGLLREAMEEDPRKQSRERAAGLVAALSHDRFALGLSGLLAALLLGAFLLALI